MWLHLGNKRRHVDMKTIKLTSSLFLGVDRSELRNAKHRLNFDNEPQKCVKTLGLESRQWFPADFGCLSSSVVLC